MFWCIRASAATLLKYVNVHVQKLHNVLSKWQLPKRQNFCFSSFVSDKHFCKHILLCIRKNNSHLVLTHRLLYMAHFSWQKTFRCKCYCHFPHHDKPFNSLALRHVAIILKGAILWFVSRIGFLGTSCEIALRRIPQNPIDDKSISVQVMAWCRQETSPYLSQCWSRYMWRHVAPLGYTELGVIWVTETYKSLHMFHMMTSSNGKFFRITGPLCGEFTGQRGIPLTKASDAGLWCFLGSVPE